MANFFFFFFFIKSPSLIPLSVSFFCFLPLPLAGTVSLGVAWWLAEAAESTKTRASPTECKKKPQKKHLMTNICSRTLETMLNSGPLDQQYQAQSSASWRCSSSCHWEGWGLHHPELWFRQRWEVPSLKGVGPALPSLLPAGHQQLQDRWGENSHDAFGVTMESISLELIVNVFN